MKFKKCCVVLSVMLFTLFCTLLLPAARFAHAQSVQYSDLWGKNGEQWDPTSRLPDFSYAGYHSGENPIPNVKVVKDVKKDFGAKGDGSADDTQAFKNAINATNNGALYIPAGRYKISSPLTINKSNIVLRGAGEGSTTLVITKPVPLVNGTVPYREGMIRFEGQKNGSKITNVSANANRGDRTLQVSSATSINPGQMIRLRMKNPSDNSLGCYLYANIGCLNAERQAWYAGNIIDWVVKVTSKSGNTITLERPLRIDVRTNWSPEIWGFNPTVQEVGIENLTIEFPNEQYRGHGEEAGYYGIYFELVFNSWIRNITITDADIGISTGNAGAGFNTVTNVTLKTKYRQPLPSGDRDTKGTTGHYGVMLIGPHTQDNLVTSSRLETVYGHNLSVQAFANGNVYSEITSQIARFDHHGAAPYENLYTDIVLTEGGQEFHQSGGIRADEPQSGARSTFWNIRKLKGSFSGLESAGEFPQMNIIGVDALSTTKPSHTSSEPWVERWPGEQTFPPNLYKAQLMRRLGQDQDLLPPAPPRRLQIAIFQN
jgi:hypothetical protein